MARLWPIPVATLSEGIHLRHLWRCTPVGVPLTRGPCSRSCSRRVHASGSVDGSVPMNSVGRQTVACGIFQRFAQLRRSHPAVVANVR